MKKSLLLLLLFCEHNFSQTVKLDGFITDSKALGLEMANVMAVNHTKAMDGDY
jgi:hypothetical protein